METLLMFGIAVYLGVGWTMVVLTEKNPSIDNMGKGFFILFFWPLYLLFIMIVSLISRRRRREDGR